MAPDRFDKYKIGIDVEADLSIKETEEDTEEEQEEEYDVVEIDVKDEEIKLMDADELDSLGKEIGVRRKSGENDVNFRERVALHEIEGNLEKCLEATFAKRKDSWHMDEIRLYNVFKNAKTDAKERFIKDYLNREEMSQENKNISQIHGVEFPEPCVLSNEMREVMIWFLGSVAPWERDPCLGCTHCPLGKESLGGEGQE